METVLVGTPSEIRENPAVFQFWNDAIPDSLQQFLELFPSFQIYQDPVFVSELDLQPEGSSHMPGTTVELGTVNGRICVRKQFYKPFLTQVTLIRLHREISIPVLFHHPNIGRVLGISENIGFVSVYLEFYSGGDFHSYLHTHSHNQLTLKQIRKFGKQLVDAVTFLHDGRILHRDLKLENLFLDSDQNLRVGDFGFCTVLTDSGSPIGTPRYASPEMLREHICRGLEPDAWSVGVILYIFYHGVFPFPSENTDRQLQEIADGLKISSKCPRRLRKILEGLLEPDPGRRMTLRKCQQSKFWK